MTRLTLIVFIFVATTLAGIAVVAALATGMDTAQPIIIAAAIGFVLGIPASWYIARKIANM